MEVQQVVQILLGLVVAASPFVLKNVNLKGSAMAWISFLVAAVIAVIGEAVGGGFAKITFPGTPETLLPVLAAAWGLQQFVYTQLKDRLKL